MARPSSSATSAQSASTSSRVATPYLSGSRVPSRLRLGPFSTAIRGGGVTLSGPWAEAGRASTGGPRAASGGPRRAGARAGGNAGGPAGFARGRPPRHIPDHGGDDDPRHGERRGARGRGHRD